MLQCVAGCCSMLQYVAGCRSMLQYIAMYCSGFAHFGVRVCACVSCSVLQCVAMWCGIRAHVCHPHQTVMSHVRPSRSTHLNTRLSVRMDVRTYITRVCPI